MLAVSLGASLTGATPASDEADDPAPGSRTAAMVTALRYARDHRSAVPRSAFDYEAAVIARVLGVTLDELMPGKSVLDKDLEDLVAGER